MMLLLGLLACDPALPPAPLPPSVQSEPTVIGRAVKAGPVEGYIARPIAPPIAPATEREGLLLRVDSVDAGAREEARRRAEAGVVVLLVGSQVDPALARSYLEAMPEVGTTRVECSGGSCP